MLCFDATTATIYFDDGLKIFPPADMISVIKNTLNGFRVLSGNDRYQMDKWNDSRLGLPLPRIGTPMQPSSGEGAASCGVGVILAIKDVIECARSTPNFSLVLYKHGTFEEGVHGSHPSMEKRFVYSKLHQYIINAIVVNVPILWPGLETNGSQLATD